MLAVRLSVESAALWPMFTVRLSVKSTALWPMLAICCPWKVRRCDWCWPFVVCVKYGAVTDIDRSFVRVKYGDLNIDNRQEIIIANTL